MVRAADLWVGALRQRHRGPLFDVRALDSLTGFAAQASLLVQNAIDGDCLATRSLARVSDVLQGG
jgi:hypothetical protein